jgi:methyl-accepting chemotaxis protein
MFGWFKGNGDRAEEIQEIRQIQLATARDISHLVEVGEQTRRDIADLAETVNLQASNITGLVQVAQAHSDQLAQTTEQLREVSQDIASLRAGQAQQASVLDYLLRKEQERQNGE